MGTSMVDRTRTVLPIIKRDIYSQYNQRCAIGMVMIVVTRYNSNK
jgi:hypothetical protein